ncbi:MAG: hypothetical protein KGN16_01705 [Burkholderiales bacterium]|nr:hypothetical protein [Burkholderiales bacterium]
MKTTTAPLLAAALTQAAALLLAAILIGSAAHAAPDAAFEPAFQQFNRAAGGDGAAIDAAAASFGALLAAEPTSPVLMAYAGAATAMKARTTWLPWKKMSYAEDGLAQIDKALALLTPADDAPRQHGVPGTLETRFIAANTFLAVPGFMNRGERGAKLLAQVTSSPLFASAPRGFRERVLQRAAKLAADQGGAK